MPELWEIEESVPPEPPPSESLTGQPAGEFTEGDAAAAAAGVTLPTDAEGEPP